VTTPEVLQRSYGCTFGCGNPYDFVFISVRDGTTEFLCLPCMVKLATDMVDVMVNPDNPDIAAKIASLAGIEQAPMSSNGAKRGRRNAPATSDDPDLFESFDSVITAEELPEAFQ
jgi:hypothetical protein